MTIDKYLVIGNPIAHSKSPFIHTEFAKQTNQTMHYDRLLVEIGHFTEALDTFRHQGGKGANVTLPFKQDALRYADEATERATIAAAANTLKFMEDGRCLADNTDGIGFIHDVLHNLNWQIKNKRVLLLGAGGAVRGILAPLLLEQPARLTLANRTLSRARDLAKQFGRYGEIQTIDFTNDTLQQMAFDLIINGTSAGLQGEIPTLPASIFTKDAACYDLVYNVDHLTPFLQWAVSVGCKQYADGLGMLVEQAAKSFYWWRGVHPDTKAVIDLLTNKKEII